MERVTRYMPDGYDHQFVTPLETLLADADLIHAHGWFGCGKTAHASHIPYVVEIVQSDLQQYHKHLIFNRKSYEQQLVEAAREFVQPPESVLRGTSEDPER